MTLLEPDVEHVEMAGGGLMLNYSGVSNAELQQLMQSNPVTARMIRWAADVGGGQTRRKGGVLDRDRYTRPKDFVGQVQLARDALDDDVVGGIAEEMEALAIAKVKPHCPDSDELDIWNQVCEELDVETQMKVAWRALITDSQYVAAVWYEKREYTPRRTGDAGRPARTTYKLTVPTAMTFLDTCKVLPVGALHFGREKLAYVATAEEAGHIDKVLEKRRSTPADAPVAGDIMRYGRSPYEPGDIGFDDPLVERLIVAKYTPTDLETIQIQNENLGFDDLTHLYELDSRFVWRHTLTRQPWERFARVRMIRVLEQLDLKAQLAQRDRATMIAGANFIVLITQGSDTTPALPAELAALRANAHQIGTIPLITGPHTLKVQIITPTQDFTLDKSRYDTVNLAIAASMYQAMMPVGTTVDDPMKLARVVAAGLESRRRGMRHDFERHLMANVIALSDNDRLKAPAGLSFVPRAIQLWFDAAYANLLADLNDSNDLSRGSMLEGLGYDQDEEAVRRWREANMPVGPEGETMDDIFLSQVPFSTPNPANPLNQPPEPGDRAAQKRAGRRKGGTRGGGGAAPGTNQGGQRQNEPEDPRRAKAAAIGQVVTAAAAAVDLLTRAQAALDALTTDEETTSD